MSYPPELPDSANINGYYLPFNYDQSTGTWNDLVGTNHFTQSNSNDRPILKDDLKNDKFKYVLFTASPWTKMTLPANITYANNSNNFTIFLVARRGKDVNSSGVFSGYDNDGRFLQDKNENFLGGWWSSREGVFYMNGWLNSGDKGYEKNWCICVFRRLNGQNKAWSIGYTGGNGGPYSASGISRNPSSGYYSHNHQGNTGTLRDLRLNDGKYNGERCDFHVGELLIYKTGLSDSDTETVIEYLEGRYFGSDGISGTGTSISAPGTSGGASVIANPLTSIDRNYNSNWVISVDKWDSYRSIGYQGNLDVAPIQAASVIAGGGGFDGSFNVVDASFRTQGDASSNWFSSSRPAQMAFNNDISFVGGQYFAVENVSAYQNGTIVSDSDNSAVKLDFLFPSPRTATEYEILPPNEISNNNALYMPNRWCIYGSSYETIDTSKPSTEENGYFLLDSRTDANPWSAHDASLISVSGGKKYRIANPGLYSQYRMSILQNSGDPSGNINIGELIYYEGGVGPLVGGGALDGRSDLSGGLALHGDVSGINGLEPIIINNYTVDVSLNRFTLNDDLQPELTLYRGETYNFNQSDIDNSGQRMFVSNDSDGRIAANNPTIVKLAGAGGVYTSGGSKHSTTPATFQLNSNTNINNNIHGSANASYSFDNNVTNINMTMSNAPSNNLIINSSNIEFGIIIIFPTQVIVNKYKMWPRRWGSSSNIYDARPRAWTLRATNNLSSYVLNTSSSYSELDDISNVQHADWPFPDDNSLINDDKYVEYTFTNTNAYTTYILNFTECNRSDFIAVSEIAYYGIDGSSAVTTSGGLSDNSAGFITTGTLGTDLSSSWTIPTDAPDTMYYTSDGSANAGGIINIANIQNIPNYNIVNLFDGSDNSLYKSPIGAFENYDLSAGKEFAVKFELPSKKKILKYDIKNTNIKSWTLRGCDNSAIYDRTDSNTYELLDGISDFISPLISKEQILAGGGALNGTGGDQGLAVDPYNHLGDTPSSTIWTAEKAFNGYDITPNNQNFWNTNNNTSNNELRFKFPYRVNITRYKLWVRQIAGHPENWEIRGAPKASTYDMNNSSTYDVLDEQTGITGWQIKPAGAIAADTHRKEFIISNTSPFYSNLYEEIIIYLLYSTWNEIEELVYIGRIATDIPHRSNIVSNPKDYTYYVLDVSSTNIIDSAELVELIYYDTGSYPSAGAGSLDGSSGDVGGLLIHGDVKGVGGQSDWAAFSGTLSDASDAFISDSGVFSTNSLTSGSEFSVKFEFPTKKYISTYRIWPQIDGSMNSPSDWYLYGCDVSSLYDRADESTYNVLDVRTGENSWPVTSASSIGDLSGYNEYTIIDPGNYSYYVLDVSASNNASLCSIGELAYYESERVDVTTIRDPQPYENHQLAINMGASEETSDWEVGEIIVFNKKLTSEEEEKVVNYLENTFYGSDGFEPVGNNSTLRLTRNNLRLPEVYSAMDPSSRGIEYFNQSDYNRIVNMNLSSINYQDISSIPIKTSDLRNRLLSTDASFTTITGVSKGYTPSSIVKLSDFRGGSGGGSGDGGTLTAADGYNIHSFTTVGTHTFTVAGSITVEFLIVGGGGGGGMDMGGGGGGGGLVKGIDYTLDSGEYIITVGDGGIGAPKGSNDAYPIGQGRTSHTYTHNGQNGDDSSIVGGTDNFIGKGGGYGGAAPHNHTLGGKGNLGGSGGGTSGYSSNSSTVQADTSQDTYTAIEGVAGYGNKGGPASGSSHYASGGGGAGGIGLTAVGTSVYPEGGPGIESDILGISYYWAGGGGGSGYSQNGGNGGDGGGGGGAVGTTTGGGGLNSGSPGGGGDRNSQTNRPGGNAGANTGGGGGGGSHYKETNQGGNGGSGIVVIRYK